MPLQIKNKTIVGTIDNLNEKLNGKIPINKLELIYFSLFFDFGYYFS